MVVEHELVFTDGSGAEGVYTMYGHRFGASASHKSATVRCLTASDSYTSRRERRTIATACKAIEERLNAWVTECQASHWDRMVAA